MAEVDWRPVGGAAAAALLAYAVLSLWFWLRGVYPIWFQWLAVGGAWLIIGIWCAPPHLLYSSRVLRARRLLSTVAERIVGRANRRSWWIPVIFAFAFVGMPYIVGARWRTTDVPYDPGEWGILCRRLPLVMETRRGEHTIYSGIQPFACVAVNYATGAVLTDDVSATLLARRELEPTVSELRRAFLSRMGTVSRVRASSDSLARKLAQLVDGPDAVRRDAAPDALTESAWDAFVAALRKNGFEGLQHLGRWMDEPAHPLANSF